MSEMCTRDYPFADVMLEKSELVHLLTGKKNDVIQRVWNDYIAKLNIEQGGWVRPCIKDKEWPGKYEKRKAFKRVWWLRFLRQNSFNFFSIFYSFITYSFSEYTDFISNSQHCN